MPALRRALPPGFSLLLTTALPRLTGSGKVDSRRLQDLAAHPTAPAEEAREAERCRQELRELRRRICRDLGCDRPCKEEVKAAMLAPGNSYELPSTFDLRDPDAH